MSGIYINDMRLHRIVHELTDLGRTLIAPLAGLEEWARTHMQQILDARRTTPLSAANRIAESGLHRWRRGHRTAETGAGHGSSD